MNLSILPKLHQAIEIGNRGAKTRRLSFIDATVAFSVHCRLTCANPGKRVRTTMLGGRVANSYKYKATSTDIVLETSKEGVTTIIRAGRVSAVKSPHGKGRCLYSTVNGRIVE